jgi:oligopeptide transport system substrate-binding protein
MQRPRMIRWLHAAGIVPLLLGLSPAPKSAAVAHDANVLRVQQAYFPDSLDPQKSAGTFLSAILGVNYEGLTRLDENLDVVPAAAASWEFDASGTVLTFHLQPDLAYSDGSPLTAERFAEAMRRACDPTVVGDYQHVLFDVVGCEDFAALPLTVGGGTPAPALDPAAYDAARRNVGVRALDERTLQVRLRQPAPYFPAIASLAIFYPAKQELIARGGDDWWRDPALQIGNGPFQITRMVPDQLVVFAANPHYWAGRPALDRIEYVYLADNAVALQAYQAGDLDIVSVDEGQLPAIERDAGLRPALTRVPGASTGYLSFNLTKAPFTDKQVRQAFAYAFDRQTYCTLVRAGGCQPTLSWIPSDIPGSIDTDAYAFDPVKARQALAASAYGGPDRLPEIKFVYWVDDPAEEARVEWIAGQYRDILGVTVTLQPMEGKALVAAMSDVATYPQLALAGWVQDYPDPQNWLSVYWACRTVFAREVGYCDARFDTLVGQGDRELDPTKRVELYEAAGRVLLDDAPGVFISHGVFIYLVKPTVRGYAPTSIDSAWPGQTASLLTVRLSD